MFCADNARIGKLEDRWRPIDFIQGIKHSRSLPGLDLLSEIDAGFKKAFMRGVDDALGFSGVQISDLPGLSARFRCCDDAKVGQDVSHALITYLESLLVNPSATKFG